MNAPLAILIAVTAMYVSFFLAYKLFRWDIGAGLGVLAGFIYIGSLIGYMLGGPGWGPVAAVSFWATVGLLLGADHWRRERCLTLAGEPQLDISPRFYVPQSDGESWSERLCRWGFPSSQQMEMQKLARQLFRR